MKADELSVSSDEVYLNIRRSVITAQRQVSQTFSFWNSLRSIFGRIHYRHLIRFLKEKEMYFDGRNFWKMDQLYLTVLIWDALRLEFSMKCFQQLMQVLDAKLCGFYSYSFQKMCGGIV